MKIKITLPKDVKKIICALENNGFSAYVVGGCVRDSILSRTINDWDICTSAKPEQVMEVFKDEYIIPTGLQHGTVTIMLNGVGYEVTTFRQDGNYSDGRHPDSVKLTSNLIEDLSRRDFTINAMAYNDNEGLIDPFGGLYDIQKRIIRCVGSPKDRFNEDALRILRAIRFSCQLDFDIASSIGWCICYTDVKDNLKSISMERINSEFCKMIICDNFYDKLLKYYSTFTLFIPELKDMIEFNYNNPWYDYDVFVHTYNALKKCETCDLITKLAILFHDIGKVYSYQAYFKCHGEIGANIVDKIMRRLKFDNYTREKVVELVYYHDVVIEADKRHIKRLLNMIGTDQFRRLLEVKIADGKAQNLEYSKKVINKIRYISDLFEEILQKNECFSLKDLSVNGQDVKDIMFLKEGKYIGHWLKKILNLVIDGELNNDREELISWMNNIEKTN